jgi:hypothetical protein
MNVTFAKQRLFDHTGWWCLIAREHKNIGKKKDNYTYTEKRNFDTVFNGNFSIFGGSCENQRLGLPASGSLSREPPWDIVPALQPRVNGKIIGLQPLFGPWKTQNSNKQNCGNMLIQPTNIGTFCAQMPLGSWWVVNWWIWTSKNNGGHLVSFTRGYKA